MMRWICMVFFKTGYLAPPRINLSEDLALIGTFERDEMSCSWHRGRGEALRSHRRRPFATPLQYPRRQTANPHIGSRTFGDLYEKERFAQFATDVSLWRTSAPACFAPTPDSSPIEGIGPTPDC